MHTAKYKPPKLLTQKKLSDTDRPSKYKPPGGLYLEIALKYKVKQRKTVNFLPRIKLIPRVSWGGCGLACGVEW